MQVLNVLRAARWKYGTQKIAKNLQSRHHRTTYSAYILALLRHVSTIGKKLVKQQYLLHMSSQYGELWPTNAWDGFGSLGHPSKFQRVSRLGFVTSANQTLHGVWLSPGLRYTIGLYTFSAVLVPNGILPRTKLSPEFARLTGNRGPDTRWCRQISVWK